MGETEVVVVGFFLREKKIQVEPNPSRAPSKMAKERSFNIVSVD